MSVRSYQRVFAPDRRIYQVEGRRLPIPGGVPLRWLGWAAGALCAVIVLCSGRTVVVLGAAVGAWACGRRLGGSRAACVAGLVAALGVVVAGWLLAGLDWPLRLVFVPALVATLIARTAPDGRAAHRYALSVISLWLSPRRRSLGRAFPATGEAVIVAGVVRVAPDERCEWLRRCRIRGPAVVWLGEPMCLRGRHRRRLVAVGRRWRRRGQRTVVVDSVALVPGQVIEVRP